MPFRPDPRPSDWEQQNVLNIQGVPSYQQDRLQCGPAALAMALTWSGEIVTPSQLETEVFTPEREGSLQVSLLSAARRHGRAAYEIHGLEELLCQLRAGFPVIVLENLGLSWVPRWHYSVVVGVDPVNDSILLNTGSGLPEQRRLDNFLYTWNRAEFWGLLVLPPEQLPECLDSQQIVASLAGLEQTNPQAAMHAYEQVTQRWPAAAQAWLGLGNCYYALGQPQQAAVAFERGCQAAPPDAVACNNLAQVLLEQGHRPEARQAIQRAIELGGPFLSDFQETLREIDASR